MEGKKLIFKAKVNCTEKGDHSLDRISKVCIDMNCKKKFQVLCSICDD